MKEIDWKKIQKVVHFKLKTFITKEMKKVKKILHYKETF
jgi:hypothetical protein